jgi:CRISPR/Cas system CSM-associated protein Csm2 small subunit
MLSSHAVQSLERNKCTRKQNFEANMTQNISNVFFMVIVTIHSKKKTGNWKRLTSNLEAELQHR